MTIQDKVRDTVNDFVQKGFMFTAFDVTKTLRNDGDRVRHNDVNQTIQSMFSNGDMGIYDRDLVNVGAPVQPWVYYHPHSDATNYSSDWIENNPTQSGMNDNDDTDDGDDLTVSSTTSDPNLAGVDVSGIDEDDEEPADEDDEDDEDDPSNQADTLTVPTATKTRVRRTVLSKANDYDCIPLKDDRLHIPKSLVSQIINGTGVRRIGVENAIAGSIRTKIVVLKADANGHYRVNADGRVRIAVKDLNYLDDTSEFLVKLEGKEIWIK